jgi:CheY-like chemotaxis protein
MASAKDKSQGVNNNSKNESLEKTDLESAPVSISSEEAKASTPGKDDEISPIKIEDSYFEKKEAINNEFRSPPSSFQTGEVKTRTDEIVPLRGRAAFTGDARDEQQGQFNLKTRIRKGLNILGHSSTPRDRIECRDPDDVPKILIVEDDADHSSVLEAVLKGVNYRVDSASNGLDALQILEKEHFDLIVCDVMMPKMNGAEFINRLRSDSRYWGIPILVLTVVSDPDKEYALLNIGADDYCEKTVKRKILLKRIENLLTRSSGRHL